MGNGGSAAAPGDEDKDGGGGGGSGEDQIIGSIGEWGRWQAKWFLVLCFVALPSGFPRDWKGKRSLHRWSKLNLNFMILIRSVMKQISK